jgi:hypothetical protein
VQLVSLKENPVPVTLTRVPGEPLTGFRVIVGPFTVKIVSTKTPEGLPVTLIVYGPGVAVLETTKLLPLKLPPIELDMTQLDCPTTDPEIEQVVSPLPTVPFTRIGCPRDPIVGLMKIEVTENVVWALMKWLCAAPDVLSVMLTMNV